jgi:hypothetical protein
MDHASTQATSNHSADRKLSTLLHYLNFASLACLLAADQVTMISFALVGYLSTHLSTSILFI